MQLYLKRNKEKMKKYPMIEGSWLKNKRVREKQTQRWGMLNLFEETAGTPLWLNWGRGEELQENNWTIGILQARLQQYMNCELPDVQAGFRKGRGTRDQFANICWIIEKAREFQKNIYFCFIDYSKAFGCVDHNKLWKILQEMGIPDHLICLLKNL